MFTTETKTSAVSLTDNAITKVREILDMQDPKPAGLRISVVGGGCSGFSYSMAFENAPGLMDKIYTYDDLKVFVDQASLLYLDGARVEGETNEYLVQRFPKMDYIVRARLLE